MGKSIMITIIILNYFISSSRVYLLGTIYATINNLKQSSIIIQRMLNGYRSVTDVLTTYQANIKNIRKYIFPTVK